MAETATKLPIKTETPKAEPATREWWPFESLRREIDRLYDDFRAGTWRSPFGRSALDVEPFWRGEISWGKTPAIDVAESEKEYKITAELPGMDEKDIEVNFADGMLTIKGEKREKKEEKKKDYYLSERRYGSFSRALRLPTGVDESKIDASAKDGVLTVTLPKTAEAQKKQKKIEIKKG
jgi:HSP20 family protein